MKRFALGTAPNQSQEATRDLISKLKDWIINNTFNEMNEFKDTKISLIYREV